MKNIIRLIILLTVVVTSCTNKSEFILLPYHSDTTEMSYSYLVSNQPKSLDSLDKLLITFFVNTNNYLEINNMWFYSKNRTTMYFINNPDDPGGWSSEELSDYYAGSKKPQSGLGRISRWPCGSDSSKFIYKYSNIKKEYDEMIIILRDECTPGWIDVNKHNELVRLFNENMPFE